MPSTYTELKLELIANGEQSGTWGTTTNVNLGTAIEEALVNTSLIAFTGADKTLTLIDSNASQPARNMRLNLLGTSGGARNLTVPAIQKNYIVANNLADAVTVKTPLGTGITIPAGNTGLLYVDGTNVLQAFDFLPTAKFNSLTLTNPLPVTSGGTGVASYSAGGALYAPTSTSISSGTLPTTAGGTGLTSYTSGGAVYATSTSSLTTGTLPPASGGTGLTSYTSGGAVYATSTSALTTGTLPTTAGGTNSTATPTAGGVSYGTGSAYAFTPAGTVGQVLVSNGSSAPVWSTSAGVFLTWQPVQSSNFVAIAGNAYPVNTTSSAVTITLPPAPIAGQMLLFTDYAGTWNIRNVTLSRNGQNIFGLSSNYVLSGARTALFLVYVDSSQGWVQVSTASPLASYTASAFLVAGGGGGGGNGGGGAGGYIDTVNTISIVPGVPYSIIVGAGGASGGTGSANCFPGTNSSAFGFNAVGGGNGNNSSGVAGAGGSGGGWGGSGGTGGAGTTGQGFRGGNFGSVVSGSPGAGGGGGTVQGADGGGSSTAGGNGYTWSVNATAYAGGGGGGAFNAGVGAGGTGGGAAGGKNGAAAGTTTVNSGGGGGGGYQNSAGANGVVIIYYLGLQRGTGGTVTSAGGYTFHTFTTSGTYTG